jgi:hypothetical protein
MAMDEATKVDETASNGPDLPYVYEVVLRFDVADNELAKFFEGIQHLVDTAVDSIEHVEAVVEIRRGKNNWRD